MSTHVQLTEPSLSPHVRKGREGKGSLEGNGSTNSNRHLANASELDSPAAANGKRALTHLRDVLELKAQR